VLLKNRFSSHIPQECLELGLWCLMPLSTIFQLPISWRSVLLVMFVKYRSLKEFFFKKVTIISMNNQSDRSNMLQINKYHHKGHV
jgi:hypothetical protein